MYHKRSAASRIATLLQQRSAALRIAALLPATPLSGVQVQETLSGVRVQETVSDSTAPADSTQSASSSSVAKVSGASAQVAQESSSTAMVKQRVAVGPSHVHLEPGVSELQSALAGLDHPTRVRQQSLLAQLNEPMPLIGLGAIVGLMLAVTRLLRWKPPD